MELKDLVMRRLSPELRDFVDAEGDSVIGQEVDRLKSLDVLVPSPKQQPQQVILALEFTRKAREERLPQVSQPLTLKPEPIEEIRLDLLARKVSGEIEDLRELLFGHRAAPFKTRGQAKRWLDDQSELENCAVVTVTDPLEYATLLRDMPTEDVGGRPLGIKDVVEACRRSIPNQLLRYLESQADRLDGKLAWGSREVVMHILTGRLPHVGTSITITRAGAGSVTIKFQRADLKYEDLRRIYRKIREGLGLTKIKGVTEEDLELYHFLSSRSPDVWSNGVIEGYTALQAEFREGHPKKWTGDKSGYEGMRKALGRLNDKIPISHLLPQDKTASNDRSK